MNNKSETELLFEKGNIKFKNFNKIFFPKICIICGVETENTITKIINGYFIHGFDYKKNYVFNIPVCYSCKQGIEFKTGLINSKYGIYTLIIILMSIFLASYVNFLSYAIFFSLSIFIIFFILALIYYFKKSKQKIKLEKYIKISIDSHNPNNIEIRFANSEYSKVIKNINSLMIDSRNKNNTLNQKELKSK